MEEEKYREAQGIKNRIDNLKMIKRYMESLLSNKRLGMKMQLQIFNADYSNVTDLNYPRPEAIMESEDDAKFIIDSIDTRIRDLEKQFIQV